MNVLFTRGYSNHFGIILLLSSIFAGLVGLSLIILVDNLGLPAYYPPLVITGLFLAVAIMHWPWLGIYLALLTAPIETGLVYVAGFGMYAFQPIVMLTATAVLIRSLLGSGKILVPREMWPVIGLWLTYVLSAFFAIDMETTLGGIVYFIPLLALCWVFAKEVYTLAYLERIVAGVIWVGVILALLGLMQLVLYHAGFTIAFGPRHANFLRLYGRPSGLQGEPNWFGIYAGMILAIALPLWMRKQSISRSPVITVLVIAILSMAVLVSGTRSAWMGLLVAGGLYLLFGKVHLQRKIAILLGAGMLLGAILLALAIIAPQTLEPLNRLRYLFDTSEVNSRVRTNTWSQSFKYIRLHPIKGYGLSAWEVISPQVRENTGIVVIDGKSVPNIFLENWLSAGLPGLLFTVIFCAYYLFNLWDLSRRRNNYRLSVYLEGILGGLIMVLVASLFTNAFKHNWFWMLIALAISALRLAAQDKYRLGQTS